MSEQAVRGIFDRPPQTNKWMAYQLVRGSWEIAREGDYVLGVICIAHREEEAELLVNALNFWEEHQRKALAEAKP